MLRKPMFVCLALALVALVTSDAGASIQKAALIGSTITLSCPRKQGKTEFEVMKWAKGRDTIFEDEGKVMTDAWTSNKFDLNTDSATDYNLTINTIESKDKDSYVCLIDDMDNDEQTTLKEYDLVVVENPTCQVVGGSNKLVRGRSYDFTCESKVNDVTLLWSVGTAEKSVGENIIDIGDATDTTYKTKKTIVADASLQGQSVDCELQHPAWSVSGGVLKCSVGDIVVENAVVITCDEHDQKGEGIVCVVKARDNEGEPIKKEDIEWVVEGGEAPTPVDPKMIEPLEDGTGFTISLTTDLNGEMHALRVGEDEGPWQKMPAEKAQKDGATGGGDSTGMIVVIVVIAILLVAIVVIVVLWKRKIIFSASKTKEADAEKGAPKLNGVTFNNGDEKNLLDNKDVSNVDKEKKEEEERRPSNASSEDDKKLIIDDSTPTKLQNETDQH